MSVREHDSTDRRVKQIVGHGVLDAYRGRPFLAEPVCECGDGLSAHHGEDGELHCGETGCGCPVFRRRDDQ